MFDNYHEWSDDQIKEKYHEILNWVSERSAEKAGTTNCYTCEKCHRSEKYIYIDSGVTPFMNTCNFCGELAQSSFGRDILPNIPATMEWFRPELEELLELKNSTDESDHYRLEHYMNGGLKSRKRFSGKNIIIIASGGRGRVSQTEILSYLNNHKSSVVIIDTPVEPLPIPEPPKPVKIPLRNIPSAPIKTRQQRRLEERKNKKKR